jgi:polyhydroxyalkanoate synthase
LKVTQRMPHSAGTPEALLDSIARAENQVIDGWLPLATAVPARSELDLLAGLAREPARLAELQARYVESQARLWAAMLEGKDGADGAEAGTSPGDKRFAAREWREDPYYSYLRQSYLLTADYLAQLADSAAAEPRTKERLRFAVKQLSDAICPANFAATNPEVLRRAHQSQGESLVRGFAHLIADAQKGRIAQTDEAAFEVGRNLAVTPGDVIYENDLMQLIQYAAATPEVAARPLIMVPPCINKYYLLDMQPENSLVRHVVEQGHTVFMVSWRNVGPAQGHYRWDDYLRLGVFDAIRVAREISGAERVNALGFCVGGTILGAALAVLSAKGERTVESVTYLTTMLDFAEPGQIGLFVDEQSIAQREATIGKGGLLPGADLAFVFSALRANDLIWPYVVRNYLLGEPPPAFDLLYWNSDSTNLPGPMYCYYVRNTYLENKLCVPGALENCGVKLDLGKVDRPAFILATREDHIVPWRAAYRSLRHLGGEKTFVLGASGHVAGVINPAGKNRRSFWADAGAAPSHPQDPEAWLARATEHRGSWWPRWIEWLSRHRGGSRAAPDQTGGAAYPALEPAPGRYVRQKAN